MNSSIVDDLVVLDDLLFKALLIMIVYVVGNILSLVIGYYLESRKLKLLMSARPEVLAVEFVRIMREYVREYGAIRSSDRPGYLVVRKWFTSYDFRTRLLKALFLIFVVILIVYLASLLYGGV